MDRNFDFTVSSILLHSRIDVISKCQYDLHSKNYSSLKTSYRGYNFGVDAVEVNYWPRTLKMSCEK